MWLPLNGNSATSPIWQLKDQLISAASKCASTKGRCVIWNVDQDDAAHPYLSTGQSDEGANSLNQLFGKRFLSNAPECRQRIGSTFG